MKLSASTVKCSSREWASQAYSQYFDTPSHSGAVLMNPGLQQPPRTTQCGSSNNEELMNLDAVTLDTQFCHVGG